MQIIDGPIPVVHVAGDAAEEQSGGECMPDKLQGCSYNTKNKNVIKEVNHMWAH